MEENPLVSIIIPLFNRADLIREALDSVKNQSYKHWECILIDDHSTDRSSEIVQKHYSADPRIKLFLRPNGKPKGANSCRNEGLRLAKGEVIQFLDSDDLLHPQKLEMQVKLLQAGDRKIVLSQHQAFHSTDELDFSSNGLLLTVTVIDNLFEKFVCNKLFILISSPIFRREILINEKFDEKLTRAQEADYFARIFAKEDHALLIEHPLFFYRQTSDSITKEFLAGERRHVVSLLNFHKNAVQIAKRLRPGSLQSVQREVLWQKKGLLFSNIQRKRYSLSLRIFLEALIQASFRKRIELLACFPGIVLYTVTGKGKRFGEWKV